jgi:cellulose biosynthesis protein BcsQ
LRDYIQTSKSYGTAVIKLVDEISKTNIYDFIMIDTSPDIDDGVQALFQIAHLAIIPYIAETKCNESMDELIEALPEFQNLNKKLKVVIAPNR